jgi:proteasome accessory factor B
VLELVFAALRSATRLTILYRSPGSAPAKRDIDPYHGIRYEGDWYVLAYCHLRQAIRTFSLARILSAQATTIDFTRPEHFDFQALFASHFGIHWGRGATVVRVHFSPSAAAFIRERQWHPSQTIEDLDDGGLILTLTVNHLLELKRWILSWGPSARVLSPAHLVEEFRNTAAAMTGIYRPTNMQHD